VSFQQVVRSEEAEVAKLPCFVVRPWNTDRWPVNGS
jgi:hypothetical protein